MFLLPPVEVNRPTHSLSEPQKRAERPDAPDPGNCGLMTRLVEQPVTLKAS